MQISALLQKIEGIEAAGWLGVAYYQIALSDGDPKALCSIQDLKDLQTGMNELLDLITEQFKEHGEVRLEQVLKKFGRESDYCKLKGIEPDDVNDWNYPT